MRVFATAFPGFGGLLARSVRNSEPGFDGRCDIVAFEGRGPVPLAEDLFASVSSARAVANPSVLADRLWDLADVERALSFRAEEARHGRAQRFVVRGAMTFRVIVRLLDERRFERRALRDAMIRTIAASRRRWRVGDPADLEFWVLETAPGLLRCGLRMTARAARPVERPGALRPSVAHAMLSLRRCSGGVLCDPCCGSGSIVGACAAGVGFDVDPAAIAAARRNVPTGVFAIADAARLPLAGASVDAVVSNLPWGHQYRGSAHEFVPEFARILRPGGDLILLTAPSFKPDGLQIRERLNVRILGRAAVLWHLGV